MKLLIIDDDDISSYVSTRFAQNSGLFTQIQALHNGMDAVEYFQRVSAGETEAPDIVIVDLNMPLMNGFDFIQALRSMTFPNKERLEIVILTSSENALDVERARAIGIEHYVAKSAIQKDLQSTLFSIYNKNRGPVGGPDTTTTPKRNLG